ncbi:MAG: hypothetical protein WCV91_06885 [Candidatus Margulisiibacteriota bacterium]
MSELSGVSGYHVYQYQSNDYYVRVLPNQYYRSGRDYKEVEDDKLLIPEEWFDKPSGYSISINNIPAWQVTRGEEYISACGDSKAIMCSDFFEDNKGTPHVLHPEQLQIGDIQNIPPSDVTLFGMSLLCQAYIETKAGEYQKAIDALTNFASIERAFGADGLISYDSPEPIALLYETLTILAKDGFLDHFHRAMSIIKNHTIRSVILAVNLESKIRTISYSGDSIIQTSEQSFTTNTPLEKALVSICLDVFVNIEASSPFQVDLQLLLNNWEIVAPVLLTILMTKPVREQNKMNSNWEETYSRPNYEAALLLGKISMLARKEGCLEVLQFIKEHASKEIVRLLSFNNPRPGIDFGYVYILYPLRRAVLQALVDIGDPSVIPAIASSGNINYCSPYNSGPYGDGQCYSVINEKRLAIEYLSKQIESGSFVLPPEILQYRGQHVKIR